MKKLFKIFTYFIVIILFLVLALLITAKLAENKITDLVLKKVSESVEAPVTIDHVSFNLLRKFPLATIELENVLLGAHKIPNQSDSISNNLDTIISIQKVYVSVKSRPLIDGIIDVIKVDVNGAKMNYLVDTSGVSNIDFLIKSSETEESDTVSSEPLDFTLTDLSIENLICNYDDLSLKAKARIEIPELKVKAKIKGENINASVNGAVSLSKCGFDKTNLNLMNKTDLNFNVDYENDSIRINQLEIFTDGAKMDVLGYALLGDEIKMDLKINGSDLILGELIKYAPKEMLKEYGLQKVSGKMNLNTIVKGTYSANEMPRVDVTVNLQKGNITTADYPQLKNISFSGKLTNGILRNNKSTQANFSSFHFETEQSQFDLQFSVLDIDHPKYDLKTNMNINITEFRKYIPDSLVKSVDGKLKLELSIKGQVPDSIGDDFVKSALANTRANMELVEFNVEMDSTISIKNLSGKIAYKPNNVSVTDLYLSVPTYQAQINNTSFDLFFNGDINNLSDMSLDLIAYHINKENSEFSGSAKVKNFDRPSYDITTNIKLNLDEVKKMLPDTLINTLTGNLYADIESSGTLNLDSITDQAMDIVFKSSSFKLNFDNVSVEMPDYPLYKLEKFTGFVSMYPDSINIMKASGIVAGIEFGIDSTKIENVYNSVIKNNAELLTVNTRISLGDLNYTMFAPFMVTDTTIVSEQIPMDETSAEPTRFKMLIKGAAKVRSLTYDKVLVQDISTLFNVKDSVYTLDKLKFKAFNGKMNTSVKYIMKPDNKSIIEMHNIIVRMDVKKLLADFDDFKDFYEPSITSENLSGLFSTDLYSKFEMVGDSMIQENTRIKGALMLENGGVYNFAPAMEMSRFTGIKELDNIQFKTLQSNIFMFKNKLYVPTTNIVSTALDITAYGMQSMGDDYEYHFQLHLGDVLKGKSKKLLKEQSKNGDMVKKEDIERSSVNLVYSLIEGKTKTGFDNKNLQSAMKNRIRVQETMLDLIFHPGMVNFDTNVYPTKK